MEARGLHARTAHIEARGAHARTAHIEARGAHLSHESWRRLLSVLLCVVVCVVVCVLYVSASLRHPASQQQESGCCVYTVFLRAYAVVDLRAYAVVDLRACALVDFDVSSFSH